MNGKRFFATVSGLVLVLAMGSPVLASTDKAQSRPEIVQVAAKSKRPAQKVRTFTAVFSIAGSDPRLLPDLSAAVDVPLSAVAGRAEQAQNTRKPD